MKYANTSRINARMVEMLLEIHEWRGWPRLSEWKPDYRTLQALQGRGLVSVEVVGKSNHPRAVAILTPAGDAFCEGYLCRARTQEHQSREQGGES